MLARKLTVIIGKTSNAAEHLSLMVTQNRTGKKNLNLIAGSQSLSQSTIGKNSDCKPNLKFQPDS